jgi:hypothetical protein
MGLDRIVRFPSADTPTWEAVRQELSRLGENVSLRMIDGLPAFPDEQPEPGWKELRLGLAGGMVTLRRGPGALTCVIWGSCDPTLQQSWNKVVWACAAAGSGMIDTPAGPRTAEVFARENGIAV